MGRIVLEVDEEVAKAWRNAPAEFRENLEKDLALQIAEKVRQPGKSDFFHYLDEVQAQTKANGLTEATLQDLLNGE